MRHLIALSMCLFVLSCAAWSQDSPDNQPAQDAQSNQETITVPKSEFDALKARVDEMERELQELKTKQAPPQSAEKELSTTPIAGGKQLALPDISLIVQAKGKLTDDKRDPEKQKLQLSEAELGIQGYVYPNVKADAFITGSPSENSPFQVEEAYLTYLGVTKGLNFYVGKKHVPFGRTNLLHNHSWLYTRQPLVISNFVAGESLSGQGADFSYLVPTHSNLFAQLDLGTWGNGDEGEESNLPNIVAGPGANLTDRFNTARLWTSYPVSQNSELELGGSWAGGKSNEDPITALTDYVHIKGVDLSYRHFGEGSSRLLLRGEQFWRNGTTDSNDATANGYYLFGNYRWNKYGSIGLLYDWSEFPQAVNLHESALSLILTKQFSEQYYLRLQAIHGERPDSGLFNELWLQWVWGVGPHTHNLE
ncbi:MAG: hypothetical protein M1133_07075 [Armatimonadetes bacterium]|nr:hypothetical protein [Armatimonadota bacterium]